MRARWGADGGGRTPRSHALWHARTSVLFDADALGNRVARRSGLRRGKSHTPGPRWSRLGRQCRSARTAPIPPALVDWDSCPSGWSAVRDGDVVACEPWSTRPAVACPDGEAWFVGGDACEPVGAACPAGEYADDLPTSGSVLHVRAGAAAGGDGSTASPLGTVAAALARADAGTTIAIAKGTYVEDALEVPAGVDVIGACAAETLLRTERVEPGLALVSVRAGTVSIAGVTVSGSLGGLAAAGPGIRVESAASSSATRSATECCLRTALISPDGCRHTGHRRRDRRRGRRDRGRDDARR